MSDKDVMISIRGLHKHFGNLEVLKGIDLDVHRGEKVVILGPSGSGKSTMLRCIKRRRYQGQTRYNRLSCRPRPGR